jgi:hypothetical protein
VQICGFVKVIFELSVLGSQRKSTPRSLQGCLIDNLIPISQYPWLRRRSVYNTTSSFLYLWSLVRITALPRSRDFGIFTFGQWRSLQPRMITKFVEHFTTERTFHPQGCQSVQRCRTATFFSRADVGTSFDNLSTAKASGPGTNVTVSSPCAEESHVPSERLEVAQAASHGLDSSRTSDLATAFRRALPAISRLTLMDGHGVVEIPASHRESPRIIVHVISPTVAHE